MKEHAIVCSDYIIKVIQLAYPNDLEKITQERTWQAKKLRELIIKNQ